MEEREEKSAGSDPVVRWDSFLPGGSLRVLLVEGDDSTRQIIAALLRKCNYKVSAVSDGIEAWKILKERPNSMDLVLVEVEVPSISGLDLLTMIMDHETCKNIPVIMMSSHDSMNVVYKCMLKGAADFLVKPIRRNELRNLWQHVWRRHSLTDSHVSKGVHHDGNLAKQRHEDMSENGKDSSGYFQSTKKDKECSEKGSDAESSCTRSDMEAESAYEQIRKEPKQINSRSLSLSKGSILKNGEKQTQQNSSLQVHENQEEEPFDGKHMSNELLVEEERSCALVEAANEDLKPTESLAKDNNVNDTEEQNRYQDTPMKEAINLIGMMENQVNSVHRKRDSTSTKRGNSDDMEIIYDKDVSCKSSSMPLLELSLRRYQHSNFEGERGECSTLNHSGSSAFSQYNSRTPVATTLTPTNFPADCEERFGTSSRHAADQGSGDCSGASRWYGPMLNMNGQDAMSYGVGFSTQNGKAIKCSPLRLIPLTIPVGGMNFDSSGSGYHPLMIPMFYPQSSAATPLWNNIPSMSQEAIHTDSSHHQSDGPSPVSPSHHAEQMQVKYLEPRDEQMHIPLVGDSGSSSICNGAANHLNKSGGVNICNKNKVSNSCNTSVEVGDEAKKLTDICHLSQREASLIKFRMKRKDRCFEKKVRYQSRQRLAEQRPRVKGQFVRHLQPDTPPPPPPPHTHTHTHGGLACMLHFFDDVNKRFPANENHVHNFSGSSFVVYLEKP